jgi:hypothetical protein
VFLGYGNGSFATAIVIVTGSDPTSIAVDDFNHDNLSDLVVTH